MITDAVQGIFQDVAKAIQSSYHDNIPNQTKILFHHS